MSKKVIFDLKTKKYYTATTRELVENFSTLKKDGDEINVAVEFNRLSQSGIANIQKVINDCKTYGYNFEGVEFIDNYYKRDSISTLKKYFEQIKKLNVKLDIRIDLICHVNEEDYFNALKQIKDFAKRINKYTYNGQKLSVLERYILAFHFVANRVYNMDKDFSNNQMRNWVGVLTSDYVICSGYASLLTKVCSEIFMPNEVICFKQSSNVYDRAGHILGGHANNLIYIQDKKYNLNGVYHSDSCWCSPKTISTVKEADQIDFNYCLLPLKELLVSTKYNFQFRNDIFIYNYIKANVDPSHSIIYNTDENQIEHYLLNKHGYKSIVNFVEEMSQTKYRRSQEIKRKKYQQELAEKIKSVIGNSGYDLNGILRTKVPQFLVLRVVAENNKEIRKFLEQLLQLINGKKADIKFICDVVKSSMMKDLLKKVNTIETNITTQCTFQKLLLTMISCEQDYSDNYSEYIKQMRDSEANKFLKKHSKIIDPSKLDADIYSVPFEILGKFIGIEDANVRKLFVERKIEETKNLANKDFAGVFEPIVKEVPEEFDF